MQPLDQQPGPRQQGSRVPTNQIKSKWFHVALPWAAGMGKGEEEPLPLMGARIEEKERETDLSEI